MKKYFVILLISALSVPCYAMDQMAQEVTIRDQVAPDIHSLECVGVEFFVATRQEYKKISQTLGFLPSYQAGEFNEKDLSVRFKQPVKIDLILSILQCRNFKRENYNLRVS